MKQILEIDVTVDMSQCSELISKAGRVAILPFTGTVSGEVFQGEVLPGAVDCQIATTSGENTMDARYMMKGVDKAGQPCQLFIRNVVSFPKNFFKMPFVSYPKMYTDSEVLADYLQADHFVGEGHPKEGGVIIKIFDINLD